jgi:ATP-dependent Clp protease protease subunit
MADDAPNEEDSAAERELRAASVPERPWLEQNRALALGLGSLVLCGGAPGKRAALPNSRIMIHQPHGGAQGQTTDIEVQTKEMRWMRDKIEEIYVEHTGQDREQVHKDIERDRFMSPQDGIEYGLIDRIYTFRGEAGAGPRPTTKAAAGF